MEGVCFGLGNLWWLRLRGLCPGMGRLWESLSWDVRDRCPVGVPTPITRPLPVPCHGVLRGRGPANAAEQVWGADTGRDGALLPGRDCHGHRLGAPAGLRAQVGVAGAQGRGNRRAVILQRVGPGETTREKLAYPPPLPSSLRTGTLSRTTSCWTAAATSAWPTSAPASSCGRMER